MMAETPRSYCDVEEYPSFEAMPTSKLRQPILFLLGSAACKFLEVYVP
jgi:hypothetical protein